MELPLTVRFRQLKATSKETVGVYRLDHCHLQIGYVETLAI